MDIVPIRWAPTLEVSVPRDHLTDYDLTVTMEIDTERTRRHAT